MCIRQFGVSTVTLWRWSQTFAHGGVLALGRDRSGPKGPTKLTEVVTARIVALDGQGRTLAQIAAGTAVRRGPTRPGPSRSTPRCPQRSGPTSGPAHPGPVSYTHLTLPTNREV